MRALEDTFLAELRLQHRQRSGRATLCLAWPAPERLLASREDFLHPEELSVLASMDFEKRRRSYALGRYCAKQALGQHLGSDEPRWTHVERGVFEQPVVLHPGASGVQVSLSHCGELGAAVAFPEAWPLGVDVERASGAAEPRVLLLPPEQGLLEAVRLPEGVHAATLLWTAKEALSKALRTGLAASLECYEIDSVEVGQDAVRCAFRHFKQYRATSWLLGGFICTLAHPAEAVLEVELPALRAAAERLGRVAGAARPRSSGRAPVVFMFSGQGSQYHHMGRELLEREGVFRDWMERANAHLRRRFGLDVLGFIYDPAKSKSHPFDDTLYSHPALFMVEYALAQFLFSRGRRPDYLLGSSLGEFTAAAVAGVLDFEAALDAVVTHALTVRERCPPGGMTAVLAPEALFHAERELHGRTELAASNFEGNFVIAGAPEPLRAAERFLKERQIRFQSLAVSFGFHSSLMEPGRDAFLDYLRRVSLRPPSLPLISCAEAGLLERPTHEHFWNAGRVPIRMQQTLAALLRRGEHTFVDVGPSGTLASCVKYNAVAGAPSRSLAAMTPFGNDLRTLAAVEAALPASN